MNGTATTCQTRTAAATAAAGDQRRDPTRRAGYARSASSARESRAQPRLSRNRSVRLRVCGAGKSANQSELGREVWPPGRRGRDPGGVGLRQPSLHIGDQRLVAQTVWLAGHCVLLSISRTRRIRRPSVTSRGTLPRRLLGRATTPPGSNCGELDRVGKATPPVGQPAPDGEHDGTDSTPYPSGDRRAFWL